MANLYTSYLDDDIRRALGGDYPITSKRSPVASLAGPVAAPASPGPPLPGARPAPPQLPPPVTADPGLAEYATRFADNKADATAQASRDLGASTMSDAQTVGLKEPIRKSDSSDSDGWLKVLDAVASGFAGRPYDAGFWDSRQDRREAKRDKAMAKREAELKKVQAEQDADPASERSMRAKAAHMGMLRQLLNEDEIATLSAADIDKITQGGNLAMHMADARAKAADARAKAEAEAAAQAEERAYNEDKWARQNAVTSEQSMDRARVMSGMAGARQIQGLLAADALQAAREQARRDADAARDEGKRANEGAKDYGVALGKTGIPKAEEKIAKVEELAAKLKAKNGGKLFSEGDDIMRRSVDAVNRPEGYALLSDPDAAEMMRNVQELRNLQIKDQAGGNVTDSEFGRQQVAMGSSAFDDAETILRWTSGMRSGLEADKTNLLGAYGPEAVETYNKNRQAAKPAARKVRIRDPKTGRTGRYDGTAEEATADGYEVVQ